MDNISQGNFEVVPNEPEVPPLPSEDNIHAFVHHRRMQLVKEMMKTDGRMPDDPKDRLVMLAALKDMDSSALNRKRLAVESSNGEITAGAAAVIAKLLTSVSNHSKRESAPAVARAAPKLGPEFPEPKLLEGETAVTLPQQSYDAFMSKFPRPGEAQE